MDKALTLELMPTDRDRRIADVVEREGGRLRSFIRRQVGVEEAEDILQDVFYELVAAYQLMKPIEQVGAWLFRVARNRIVDLYRRRRGARSVDGGSPDASPAPQGGPDTLYARQVFLDELEAALDELPQEQRDVFVAQELEGRSFKDLSAATGVSVNTLLSRKHYAVLHLRRRLGAIYEEIRNA